MVTITQREKEFLISIVKGSFDNVRQKLDRAQDLVSSFDAQVYADQFLETQNNMSSSAYLTRIQAEATNLQNQRDRYIKLRDWIIAAPLTV